MKKTQKLYLLSAALVVVCLITYGASKIERQKENIQINGSTILSVPVPSVTGFSLKQNGDDYLSFHKENDGWIYDNDILFPASTEKIEDLLSQFEDFSASFTIEEVEDFSQYGLDNPIATVVLETDDQSFEICMGAYSSMDNQRYVSIGDGNAYLAVNDPMDTIDLTLRDLIENVTIPSLEQVHSIQFGSKEHSYSITYKEAGGPSYRPDDVWFADIDGALAPLDTNRVESYIQAVNTTYLINYADYHAEEDELSKYGLDHPELTIQIEYINDEDKAESFVLYISRDPDELAKSDDDSSQSDHITSYARVEGSAIVYNLDSIDYESLLAYQYDELRHNSVMPANIEDVAQFEFIVDDQHYRFDSSRSGEDQIWNYNDTEINSVDFKKAVTSVTVDKFTQEAPNSSKVELSYIATLDSSDLTAISVDFFRYDGTSCLAVVNGTPLGLVLRSKVIDLAETINSIVLSPADLSGLS